MKERCSKSNSCYIVKLYLMMIKGIITKIQKMPTLHSWILLFFLNFLWQVTVLFFASAIFGVSDADKGPEYATPISFLLIAVIMAPLIETLIFQIGLYLFFKEGFRCKTLGICIASGIIFGLLHYYSLTYIIVTSFAGFSLQLWFIIYEKKYEWKRAFLLIAALHSLHNLIGFVCRILNI